MIYNINFELVLKFFMVFICTAGITLIGFMFLRTKRTKIYIGFLNFSIMVYSGFGLVYSELQLGGKFFIDYFLFITVTTFSFSFIVKSLKVKDSNKQKRIKYNINLKYFLVPFFMVYFVRLVYPELRIMDFFTPVLSIENIFDRRDGLRSNIVWEIFRLINLSLFPIFMVYLNQLLNKDNKLSFFLLFIFWVYCEFATLGYISRNELLTYGMFLLIAIFSKKSVFEFNKKTFLYSGIILIALIPFLLAFESIRMNNNVGVGDFINSFLVLFNKETDYVKYHNFSISIHAIDNISGFFRWFLTLPIPSFIGGVLKENIFDVNRFFTEAYSGIKYGEHGYSVILPSIIGEGYIIYGKYFFWLHGVFLGLFLGVYIRVINRFELDTLSLFFAVQTLTIGRGGVSGYIGFAINSTFIYLVISTIYIVLKEHRRSSNEDIDNFITSY